MDVQTSILELNAFNQKVKTQHDFDAVVAQPVRAVDPDQIPNWASTSYPNGQDFVGYTILTSTSCCSRPRRCPGAVSRTANNCMLDFRRSWLRSSR